MNMNYKIRQETLSEQTVERLARSQRKYGACVIDPPWDVNQKGHYGAVKHYDLMTLDQIRRMPIGSLMLPDSHVWLWVTNNTLEEGFKILRGWGFEPKSIFTWFKMRMGLGVYLRNATEHVILGVRGKAPIRYKAQLNWSPFPVQDHSHKPEELYCVVRRCSPGPYLELFARRPEPGFDAWGNEIVSDIVIPGYPVPIYSDKVMKAANEETEEQ